MDCQYHRHTAANGQCHISYVECHFTGNVFLDITHIRYFGYVMSAKNVFTLTIMYMSIPWNRAPLDTRNLAIRRLEAQKIVLLWGCICSIMELRVGMNCFTTGQCKSEKGIEWFVNAIPSCWRSFAFVSTHYINASYTRELVFVYQYHDYTIGADGFSQLNRNWMLLNAFWSSQLRNQLNHVLDYLQHSAYIKTWSFEALMTLRAVW